MQSSLSSLSPLILLLLAPCTARAWSDYLRDVKPLLEHKCCACHGALRQQGGLRVDTAASVIRGGQSGAAVIPGNHADSLLIDVLTGAAGFRMPPADEGAPLTDQEIDLIRRWIDAGASGPKDERPQSDPQAWWSYQPIARPALPPVSEAGWCRSEVDFWIAAMREQRGLPHARAATKEVWLRRVFVDLIGLPPTRHDLSRFLSDDSPQAYEAVVDDLLSRPQYGERWGRHWMDIWRYSDWYGSRGINEIRYSQRHIWRWRDWIVDSLNQDKGYDQMIREMLAGDEIGGGDAAVLPATGYLGRNWYKFDRDVWMFEAVERTSEAFLGLTLRCCRCHDHKFDPVTQTEYYRFRAFFEPHDVRTDPISARTKTQKDATLGQVLADGISLVYDKHFDAKTFRYERGDSRYRDETEPLAPGTPQALGGTLDVQPIQLPVDAWYPMLRPAVRETLVEQANAQLAEASRRLEQAKSAAKAAAGKLQQFRKVNRPSQPLVVLDDDFSRPRPDVWETLNGIWQYRDGKLVQAAVTDFATLVTREKLVGDFQVHLRYRPLQPGTYRSIGFSFDYRDKGNSQDVYTSTGDKRQSVQAFHRLDGKQVYPPAGIIRTPLKVDQEAVLDVSVIGSKLTIDLNGERKLVYTLPTSRRDGKFALWVHQGAAEFLALRVTAHADSLATLKRRRAAAEQTVGTAQAEVNLAQGKLVSLETRIAAEVAKHIDQDDDLARSKAAVASAAQLQVAVLQAQVELLQASGAESKLEAAEKLAALRNAAARPASKYRPLGEQFSKTSTGRRAALATWITNPGNPRTARVAANHIWARHFGQPLVATPENFGLNGRRPTHPGLLDWLAAELIRNGWKMKGIHKKLVLSATYRMSSSRRDVGIGSHHAALESDPDNKLFWKMNSRRMEAEVVRDSTLWLAARLDLALGGPELSEKDGEKTLRRSLYFRHTPNEKMDMLEVFDGANPNGCYRRRESVVPHQSLAMMNSGLTLDAARSLAAHLRYETDFVTAAFLTVLGRRPTVVELDRCQLFLATNVERIGGQQGGPFPAGGSATIPPAAEPLQRAKENLVHVLFLHNDFVTIR